MLALPGLPAGVLFEPAISAVKDNRFDICGLRRERFNDTSHGLSQIV
jgi:hypothetical protein